MDLILPAVGRLLVASRPRPCPARTLIRLMPPVYCRGRPSCLDIVSLF